MNKLFMIDDPDVLKEYLYENIDSIDINECYNTDTLLTHHILMENIQSVEIVLNAGADPNRQNVDEKYPLFLAFDKDIAIVKLLVENNADLNLRNDDGNTILDLVFIEAGSDIRNCRTYLSYMLDLLIPNGANIFKNENIISVLPYIHKIHLDRLLKYL